MGSVEGEDMVEEESAFLLAGIFSEEANEAGLPFAVEERADGRHGVEMHMKIDFIVARDACGIDARVEAMGDIVKSRLEGG